MNQHKQKISIPLSIEEISFLIKNSDKKSFLLDYGDQIEEKPLIPKLFIEFPSELEHMANQLKRKLSSRKDKDNILIEEQLSKSNKSNETDKKRQKSSFSGKEKISKPMLKLKKKDSSSENEKEKFSKQTSKPKKRESSSEKLEFSKQQPSKPKKRDSSSQKEKEKTSKPTKLKKRGTSSSKERQLKPQNQPKLKESEMEKSYQSKPILLKSKKERSSSSERSSKSRKHKLKTKKEEFREDKLGSHCNEFKDFNVSVLKDKADASESEEDENSWNFEENNSNIEIPQEILKKKMKENMIKKFKLTKEKYFFLTHRSSRETRRILTKFTNERNISYKPTPKAFILEANDPIGMKNLEKTCETLKKKIKKEFKILIHEQNSADFHAFKKVFSSAENKKFENLYFLIYRQKDSQNKYLLFYFDEDEKQAKEWENFMNEREIRKINMIKNRYQKFYKEKEDKTKNQPYQPIRKREDFKILVEEGKLAAKFFNLKKQIIKSEMESDTDKFAFFKNLKCELVIFESSRKDREYNNSIIFHWKRSLKISKPDDSKAFDRYLGRLYANLYSELRFCVLIFKKLSIDSLPEVELENDFLWVSSQNLKKKKKLKIFIFGDPGKICEFLTEKKFRNAFENSKFKFLLKIIDFDENHEFKKMNENSAIKNIKKYKEEETCQYAEVTFKSKQFKEVFGIMNEMIKKSFPKTDKHYQHQNNELHKSFENDLRKDYFSKKKNTENDILNKGFEKRKIKNWESSFDEKVISSESKEEDHSDYENKKYL